MARSKIEPILNLPPGLKLTGIRKAEHVPTSYVKKYFPLDQYRTNKTMYAGGYEILKPLMFSLAQAASTNQQGEYLEEEGELEVYNVRINLETFKKAIVSFLESPSLALFDIVELNRRRGWNSLVLKKAEISYESDEAVIVKIKKKIYTEIQRYRRAKKGL